MAEYRRFVAYVYGYREGRKDAGAGFAKIESRNGECRMRIHLRDTQEDDGICKVYGVIREGEWLPGVYLGMMPVSGGSAEKKFVTDSDKMVVNVPNNGAISFLPDSAVVEVGCLVNKTGMQALHVTEVPSMCWGLVAAVKNYEQLAVEAAVEGDVRKMKLALLAHPLVRQWEYVEKLVPELLEANKEYLPQFHL